MLNTCVLQPEAILTEQLRRALYATRQKARIRAPERQRDGDSSDRHEHGLPGDVLERGVICVEVTPLKRGNSKGSRVAWTAQEFDYAALRRPHAPSRPTPELSSHTAAGRGTGAGVIDQDEFIGSSVALPRGPMVSTSDAPAPAALDWNETAIPFSSCGRTCLHPGRAPAGKARTRPPGPKDCSFAHRRA
jgi:hypothetical protein